MSSSNDFVEIFVNGSLKDVRNFRFNVIPGGGTLIMGNEQDGADAQIYQAYQAFK